MAKYKERIVYRFREALSRSGRLGGSDVTGLKADIRNIIPHVMGMHLGCREETCQSTGQQPTETIPYYELQQSSLKDPLNNIMTDLAWKAHRLRLNVTTNRAESVYSLLNKFNMGKRIDLASKGEYFRRTIAAGLACNDPNWIIRWFQKATKTDPGMQMNYLGLLFTS